MAIKVLVVDDSALMRKHLRQILELDGDVEVATARDGEDALHRIPEVEPDVVTLDINMPVMDGLTCLSRIMTDFPRPVLMVSSLTEKGALATFEALELGAVDYVNKPGGTVSMNLRDVGEEIRNKVRVAARARITRARGLRDRIRAQRAQTEQAITRPRPRRLGETPGLVLVGVSTGGPSTLEAMLCGLPAGFGWPVLVAQHMPGRFTAAFAKRLDSHCALTVREVDGPTPISVGTILIARGDADVVVARRLGRLVALNVSEDASTWHPSVDRMVRSAMEHIDPAQLVGVQLTGMGHDGADAMTELHRSGGRTIAESEDSAIVFGMPKELIERGGASEVLGAEQIAGRLGQWIN